MLCRTTRWLIVSLQEVMLHDICSMTPTDSPPMVSCIVYDPSGGGAALSPNTCVAKDAAHLQQLVSACDADAMLCVVPRAFNVQVLNYICNHSEHKLLWAIFHIRRNAPYLTVSCFTDTILLVQATSNGLWESSFLWAIQAHRACHHRSRISLITFGLQRPTIANQRYVDSPLTAAALGSMRTLFMEDRATCGPIIDIFPASKLPSLHILQSAIMAPKPEYALALHNGQSFGERLVVSPLAAARVGAQIHQNMTTFISGGTKGLGLVYSRQKALEGSGCLVLASRNPALHLEELKSLAASECATFVVQCDTSQQHASAALVSWTREWLPAVHSFAHAAGILGYNLIPDISAATFSAVTQSKVASANMFAEACLPLQAAALFSSTSSVWSQTGAAHYSSGNSVLDATAASGLDAGLPIVAINFGPFAEVGMGAAYADSLYAVGLPGLPPSAAHTAFHGAAYAPRTVVARINIPKFAMVNSIRGSWSLLKHLSHMRESGTSIATSGAITAIDVPRSSNVSIAPAITFDEILSLVRTSTVQILGEDVTSDNAFPASSFDSLSAVELSNSISKTFGRDVPSSLVFDYPSVAAIAVYIQSLITPAKYSSDPPTVLQMPPLQAGSANDTLVQLQTSARIPSVSKLAHKPLANNSEDAITTVSYRRWDIDALRTGESVLRVRFGGFLTGVDLFDSLAFGITPPEALLMDPQQRLLMEVTSFAAYNLLLIKCTHTHSKDTGTLAVLKCIQI